MIKNIVFDIGNVLVKFQPDQAMRNLGIDEVKIPKMAQATYDLGRTRPRRNAGI